MAISSERIPSIPPISDQEGVIDWFLRYDEKLADAGTSFSPATLEDLKRAILGVLRDNPDASSLRQHVERTWSAYSEEVLPRAASIVNDGPPEGVSEDDATQWVVLELGLAAEMRILGYFLSRKYGIDPLTGKRGKRTSGCASVFVFVLVLIVIRIVVALFRGE